jgi:hypothetical protein
MRRMNLGWNLIIIWLAETDPAQSFALVCWRTYEGARCEK